MARGRPTMVRANMIELLFHLKEIYGYELYEHYIVLFPKVTRRLIYYHLQQGVTTGEICVIETRKEKGNYSWGETAQKVYYGLGPEARPKGDLRVERYMEEMIAKAYQARQEKTQKEAKLQEMSSTHHLSNSHK